MTQGLAGLGGRGGRGGSASNDGGDGVNGTYDEQKLAVGSRVEVVFPSFFGISCWSYGALL